MSPHNQTIGTDTRLSYFIQLMANRKSSCHQTWWTAMGHAISRRFPWLTMRSMLLWVTIKPLQWLHNRRDGVSNHQPHDCLLNCLFRHRSQITSKFRVTGLCEGNSPVTGEFPAQRASNPKNVSIWWRHHALCDFLGLILRVICIQPHIIAWLVVRQTGHTTTLV